MSDRIRAILAGVGILAALVTGYFGSWLGDAVTGNATRVEIDRCYKYYSWMEEEQHRCEGYWGKFPQSVSGPVVGVPIDLTRAALVDPLYQTQYGTEIVRESYPSSVFAVIRGDAAVVVPTANLVLAPIGLLVTVACGGVLVAPALRRRRTSDAGRASDAGRDGDVGRGAVTPTESVT